MSRVFTYAQLSCITCLLFTSSHAFAQEDGDVSIQRYATSYNNAIACNAEARDLHYIFINDGFFPIEIEEMYIKTLAADTFPEDEVVYLNQDYHNKQFCREEMRLKPGQSCLIDVEVNPQNLSCPGTSLLTDGEIDRELVVKLDGFGPTQATAPIDLAVTILGSAENYAILGDTLLLEGNPPKADIASGIVQVSQDVGYAISIDDTDGDAIIFHEGAELIAGVDDNSWAFKDLQAAYQNLLNVAQDPDSPSIVDDLASVCTPLTGDLGRSIENDIHGGVYCLKGNYGGPVTFRGDENTLFIFVIDATINPFIVYSGATYVLDGNVQEKNIYWVSQTDLAMFARAELPGNVIVKHNATMGDTCRFDPNVPPSPDCSGYPIIPGTLTGRLLGLTNILYPSNPGSRMILTGNAILAP